PGFIGPSPSTSLDKGKYSVVGWITMVDCNTVGPDVSSTRRLLTACQRHSQQRPQLPGDDAERLVWLEVGDLDDLRAGLEAPTARLAVKAEREVKRHPLSRPADQRAH